MKRAAAVIVLLLMAGREALAKNTVGSTPVGRLTVTREAYVNEGMPIFHEPSSWKKNRLEWISADGKVRWYLEDVGGELNANYVVQDKRHQGSVCLGSGYPQAYQSRVSPERRWRTTLRNQFQGLLKYCESWINSTQRQVYLSEFSQAAGDFPEAIELLKRAAVEDFGGWKRRCLKWKIDRSYSPFPRTRCLRYSAKVN